MKQRMLWILVVLALVGAEPAVEDRGQKELDRLQGTWKVLRVDVNGAPMPLKAFQKVTILVKGDEITFTLEDKIYDKLTFDPDPTTKPRSADLRHTSGLKKGVRERAIYELQGDQLKLCIAQPRQKRPTDFISEEGTGQQLFLLKRAKAPAGK